MKILSFVSQYGPVTRSSGPAQSMRGVVEALDGMADISIVTPHAAYHDELGITPGQWNKDAAGVRWKTEKSSLKSLRRIAALITREQPDIVYLNSFFDPRGAIWPLICVRSGLGKRPTVILAARGELAPQALKLGGMKKRLFLWAARILGLHRKVVFQAGGAHEDKHIRSLFPANKVKTVFDVGQVPSDLVPARQRGNDNALRLLFLSRITPMKNLHLVFEALRQCSEPVRLSIYGPNRDSAYYERCRLLEDKLPSHIRVDWHGEVSSDDVISIMQQHDLFILPTRGEGFGHVIHEALCAGTPVLISDRTNWDKHLPEGLSWVLPLSDDVSPFSAIIEMVAKESVGERQRRSAKLIAANPALAARKNAIGDTRTLFAEEGRQASLSGSSRS